MKKITVLVTGVGGGGIGEQIIKALRLSNSINYTIVGTDSTSPSKGFSDVDYPQHVPRANHPEYVRTLLNLCTQFQVKAIFPGSEPELKVISQNRTAFEKNGVLVPINPENVLEICFDKTKTVDFLERNNFSFPKSKKITSPEDLNDIGFMPVVLKPSVGGSGSANIMIAQTIEELVVFGKYLLTIYPEFIAQEYVGVADHEYTVGVLTNLQGELINSIAVKRIITHGLGSKIKVKNRSGNTSLGEYLVISSGISQGQIGKYEYVTKPCEEIALKIGAKSAINIQCRYVDGRVYVFEINPRYSGTTSLRAMVGYNEPDIMVRKHILEEEIKQSFKFKAGTILRGLSETFFEV